MSPPMGGAGRPTMRDVAALAGVSLKTVSRVVNDEAGVADDVRSRVRAAVARLNYRHNLAASNLRRADGRTATIGVLLQDVSNSYSGGILRAFENVGRERGSAILAASLDEEPERERALVADLVARRVDGLVLMPATATQEYLAAEASAGLPIVFVDRAPSGLVADSVTVDNRDGARVAAEHLLAHGHRRIALLKHLDSVQTAEQRELGYLDALRGAGIAPDEALIRRGIVDSDAACLATRELLASPNPPTAIFASRNVLTIGAHRALRENGRHHDTALVGFDDFPLADLLTPALTVVRQDVSRLGALAAETLFRRLDGDQGPTRQTVVRTELIVRGSGEIAAAPAAARRDSPRGRKGSPGRVTRRAAGE